MTVAQNLRCPQPFVKRCHKSIVLRLHNPCLWDWKKGTARSCFFGFFLSFWQFNLSLSTIPIFFSLPLSDCSITPPGPSSAVCYNKQITAQTAIWRGEKWHKAQEPNVSACCNDYNRGLILLVPLLQERQTRSGLLTRSERQINELMGD